MDKQDSDNLVAAIREAGRIRRGEAQASRVFPASGRVYPGRHTPPGQARRLAGAVATLRLSERRRQNGRPEEAL
jgi:hypothetical protein